MEISDLRQMDEDSDAQESERPPSVGESKKKTTRLDPPKPFTFVNGKPVFGLPYGPEHDDD